MVSKSTLLQACSSCRRFPLPTTAFEELASSEERQGILHRCRACGLHIELRVWDREVTYLTAADARLLYLIEGPQERT